MDDQYDHIRPNEPHWGDQIDITSTACRLIFQNANSIGTDINTSKLHEICANIETFNAQIVGIAETNVNWQYRTTQHEVDNLLRQHFGHFKKVTSSALCGSETKHLPGGTMTLVNHPWASRTTTDSDKSGMGRWTEATIHGRDNRKVTIFTVYRVCQKSGPTGNNTAYAQQWHAMTRMGIDKPDPRSKVLHDLHGRLQSLIKEGHEIVVMIDANDTLETNSQFAKWVRSLELVDTIAHNHCTDEEPATYSRGTRRLDYILTTQQLQSYVTASGILPYEEFCDSDHRAVYTDIDLARYLKGAPSPMAMILRRGLISGDPRAVKRYLSGLNDFWVESAVIQRARALIAEIAPGETATQDQRDRMEAIDAEFGQGRLRSEAQCSRITSHPWSPVLDLARRKLRYWRLWVKQKQQAKDLSLKRRKVWDEAPPENEHPTWKQITAEITAARKGVRDAIRQAPLLREKHLEERAEMAAGKGEEAIAREVRLLQRIEAQRKIAKRIQRLLGRGNKGAMSHILVTEPDGSIRRVIDQTEINQLLLARNQRHFSQADGTPFTTEPLVDFFGKYGTNEASEMLLGGENEFDELEDANEATRVILRNMRALSPDLVDVHITADDLMEGYGVWGEMTSTSPSGLHLGHDKSLIKPKRHRKKSNTSSEDDDDPYETLRKEVFELKAILLNFAIQHGHVYERWKTVVNAMIEKIPGKPLLEKLRVIHLIESDFNLLIGILWGRRLQKKAERLQCLGDEQWGSRERKSAIQALADKHLTYSVSRLTRTNYATMDNDAKSCYDRIVMVFASLSSQRLGMDPKACELFLKTLEQARYHVKTQLGISEEFYCTTESATIHGPGQGGRGSPSIWIIISCLLMECLRVNSAGMTMTGPMMESLIKQYSTGFVDDVTLWTGDLTRSLQGKETPTLLLEEAAKAAQWWEQLLHTTGGKLELQKCFAYLIFWIFDEEGRPRLLEPDEFPFDIEIKDSHSKQSVRIDTKSSLESHKTLGAMENPDGNYSDEIQRLKTKSDHLARQVYTASINPHEAQQIYQSIWRPSMNYSLPLGTMTCTEANDIQSKMTCATLQSLGYNEHMPRELVFGPIELGGIGLTHLFAEQGTLKVKMILNEIRSNTTIGRKLRITLQWAQRVAGVSQPILEFPAGWLPQLDNEAFIHSLREFLAWSELGVRIGGIACPTTKRANDIVLMDKMMESELQTSFTDDDVHSVNRMRLYLQVETLAEITNASGTEITQLAWKGQRGSAIRNNGLWPNQPKPGPKTVRVWQRFLTTMCNYQKTSLTTPLGSWTHEPFQGTHDMWLHTATLQAAIRNEDKWNIYPTKEATRRGRQLQRKTGEQQELEQSIWVPADKVHNMQYGTVAASFENWEHQKYAPEQPPANNKWRKELIRYVKFRHPPGVMNSILGDSNKTILIASDGGSKDNKGTYGWTMSCNNHIVVDGLGKAWGDPMSSYRAEAFGKLAWLTLLQCYIRAGKRIKCKVESYCDNKGLVTTTALQEGNAQSTSTLCSDYDIINAINETQQQLINTGTRLQSTKHIKGHQDRTTPRRDLTVEAELNIRADKLATQARNANYDQPTHHDFPGCDIFLMSDGITQTSKEIQTLQWKWRNMELRDYYCSRFKLHHTVLDSVNWPGYAGARKRLTKAEAKFSTKFLAGWLPVGSRLERQGSAVCTCHRCDQLETCDHVMQCPALSSDTTTFLTEFADELKRIKTAAPIITALHHGLSQWLRALEPNDTQPIEPVPKETQIAYEKQEKIGWNLLPRGLLAEEWSRIQEHHSDPNSERTIGDTWCANIATWLIRRSQSRWKKRNDETMGNVNGQSDFESRQEKETKARVRYLYSRIHEISYIQRAVIFDVPIQERIQQHWQTLQRWLDVNEQTVQVCIKQHQEKMKSGQKDIRQLFRPNGRKKSTNSVAPEAPRTTMKQGLQAALTTFFQKRLQPSDNPKPKTKTKDSSQHEVRRILKFGKQMAITIFGKKRTTPFSGEPSPPLGNFQTG